MERDVLDAALRAEFAEAAACAAALTVIFGGFCMNAQAAFLALGACLFVGLFYWLYQSFDDRD